MALPWYSTLLFPNRSLNSVNTAAREAVLDNRRPFPVLFISFAPFRRVFLSDEKILGSYHALVAEDVVNLAEVMTAQVNEIIWTFAKVVTVQYQIPVNTQYSGTDSVFLTSWKMAKGGRRYVHEDGIASTFGPIFYHVVF